jgi:uncharacterized protein YkwD
MNHRLSTWSHLALAALLACVLLAQAPRQTSSAQTDPAADLLARINAARLANGLPPYALSDKLAAAAVAHSKDMAAKGRVDRNGSDGSTPRSRVVAAGYGQWAIGPVMDEAIYGGTGGAQGVFDWWQGTDADKGRLLNTRFREVGIGAATAANGWVYWTLDLGAQPNILPAFMNGGAAVANSTSVTITLTTENAVPAGEGTGTIGQPLQVRIASDDSFTGVDWQPWAAQVPFRLQPRAQQTIYVAYRDAQGRTSLYSFAVTLTNVPTSTPTPSPTWTPPPSLTPQPTSTRRATDTPAPTRTPLPTEPGQELATATTPPFTPLALLATVSLTPPTVTPRSTPRLRITPTPVPTGPYGPPPAGLATGICALQAVALVLAALAILSRVLRRVPAAPPPSPSGAAETYTTPSGSGS